MTMIFINNNASISEAELQFEFSRAGGPGGQNVNKVSTRVTLYFDVINSYSLDDIQKQKILDKLSTRVSNQGILRIVSQKYRSQKANKDETVRRFGELIRAALKKQKPRIKTSVPKQADEKRLLAKKHKGTVKKLRTEDIDLN